MVVKNVLNGCTDILKFKIDRTALTCLNYQYELSVKDGSKYGSTLIIKKLRF